MLKPQRRTEQIRESHRAEIARRYARGETQLHIAQQMGISSHVVKDDLTVIQDAWLASAVRDFDRARARELAKIDELERTYWELHKESKRPFEGERKSKQVGPKGETFRAETTRTDRSPNTAILAGIAHCIEMRITLLGLALVREQATVPDTLIIEWPDYSARALPDTLPLLEGEISAVSQDAHPPGPGTGPD